MVFRSGIHLDGKMIIGRRGFFWITAVAVFAAFTGLAWHWNNERPVRDAESAFQRGEWAAAFASAEKFLQRNPMSRRANLVAMRSLAQMGRCDAALNWAGRLSDPATEDLRLIASCLVAQGTRGRSAQSLDTASTLLRKILEREPDDSATLRIFVALLIQLDQPGEAIQWAQRLAAIPSQARAAHAMLGTIYYGQADFLAAGEHLLKVAELDPDFGQGPEPPDQLRRMLGRSLLRLGRASHAEPHLVQLVRSDRGSESLWLLGHARQQQGDADGAARRWQESVELEPEFLSALDDLGEMELARGQPERALIWLNRAAQVSPQNPTTQYRIALALQNLGQEAEARKHFAAAERLRGSR